MSDLHTCSSCGYRLDTSHLSAGTAVITCPACGEVNDLELTERANPYGAEPTSFSEGLTASKKRVGALVKSLRLLAPGEPELASLRDLVEAVRSELMVGHGPRGEALDPAELSARLAFAPKLLERLGHAALGEEVKRVRNELDALALAAPRSVASASAAAPAEAARTVAAVRTTSAHTTSPARPARARWVIAAVFGLLLVAAAALWWLGEPERDEEAPRPAKPPDETAAAAVAGTTASAAGEEHEVAGTELSPQRVSAFLDHVAEARTALLEQRPEDAATALRAAAAVTTGRAVVFELADEIRDAELARSRAAIQEERWQEADERLAAAIRLAAEFSRSLDEAERLHATLSGASWHRRVAPRDEASMHTLVGREVEVEYGNGERKQGRVVASTAQRLSLNVADGVGGGAVVYRLDVPVEKLRAVHLEDPANPVRSRQALEEAAQRRALPQLLRD